MRGEKVRNKTRTFITKITGHVGTRAVCKMIDARGHRQTQIILILGIRDARENKPSFRVLFLERGSVYTVTGDARTLLLGPVPVGLTADKGRRFV